MSVSFEFAVIVRGWEKDKPAIGLLFFTSQIASGGRGSSFDNEVEIGNVFANVKRHRLFTAVIPRHWDRAVHSLHSTPVNQANLKIEITLYRNITRPDVVQPSSLYEAPRLRNVRCTQDVAKMVLEKVQLLSVKPTAGVSYTANFRVTGGTEIEYEPAAECERWVEIGPDGQHVVPGR
jgi:hypothetical protein